MNDSAQFIKEKKVRKQKESQKKKKKQTYCVQWKLAEESAIVSTMIMTRKLSVLGATLTFKLLQVVAETCV